MIPIPTKCSVGLILAYLTVNGKIKRSKLMRPNVRIETVETKEERP